MGLLRKVLNAEVAEDTERKGENRRIAAHDGLGFPPDTL
jgi:hypothetical protein